MDSKQSTYKYYVMLNLFQHLTSVVCWKDPDTIERRGSKAGTTKTSRKDILHEKQVFGKRSQTSSG